jgi:hypothetical protein
MARAAIADLLAVEADPTGLDSLDAEWAQWAVAVEATALVFK